MTTLLSFLRVSPIWIGLVALSLAACDCGGAAARQRELCRSDEDCQDLENTFCFVATGECRTDRQECAADADCCPGQICSPTLGQCVDKFAQCDVDAACRVSGQVCREVGVFPRDTGCTFAPCGDGAACAEGLSCLNGYCVGEPPCNGGCKSGEVCTPVNNLCFRVDDTYDASCRTECPEGTILVFQDGQNVFNRCDKKKRGCECAALPPVRSDDVARHTSAALAGAQILVSAYDAEHGDLVLHTYDRSTLTRSSTTWLDGVPASGAVVGDPNGPRGGRAAAGPDVGQYSSLVWDASGARAHVSYYAARDGRTLLGDLRYGRVGVDGRFASHVVDGRSGNSDTTDVGLYSDIVLASDGAPVIAYFQRSGGASAATRTALKVARARVRDPQSAADWVVVEVQAGTRTLASCGGATCSGSSACVQTGAPGGECRPVAGNCTATCGADEECVQQSTGGAACVRLQRSGQLADLPEGNGLMPSLTYVQGKLVVVWYDRTAGVLKGVAARSDSGSSGAVFNAADIRVLDDGTSAGSTFKHDVGLFSSVAVTRGGRLAVAYLDATARQLRLLTVQSDLTGSTPAAQRVIDDGSGVVDTSVLSFVGADTDLALDPSGRLLAAYQDSTRGDLRLARETNAGSQTFERTAPATDGAGGFSVNLLSEGDDRIAVHSILKAVSASKSQNRIELLRIP